MALITIENETLKSLQILYEGEPINGTPFSFKSKDGAMTTVDFSDLGLSLVRESADGTTVLDLYDESYGEVRSGFGIMKLNIERLAYHFSTKEITVRYRVSDTFNLKIMF